ncbi:hypothetical protein [Nitrososphaera sp. AFS]|nr:hypothetical protein [Nitrososphaera sp. AFS]
MLLPDTATGAFFNASLATTGVRSMSLGTVVLRALGTKDQRP